MNNKKKLYVFLACGMVGISVIYAADSRKQLKKVTFADEPKSLLHIDLPKEPKSKQKVRDIKSPLMSSPLERRSPRCDGVLLSPVLSSAGARVLESSPRISYAGVQLKPLSPHVMDSARSLSGTCISESKK